MPIVSYFMTSGYQERAEDILTVANESRPSDKKLGDRTEWERSVIRNYTSNLISNYRQYESTKKMPDPRTVVIDASGTKVLEPAKQVDMSLKISGAKNIPINSAASKARPFKCAAPLGEKQVEWLQLGMVFYREYEKALNSIPGTRKMDPSFENRARSVGELIELILDDAAWRMIAQADIKALESEELPKDEVPKPK